MRSKKFGGGIYGRREECGEDGEGGEWKKKGKDEKETIYLGGFDINSLFHKGLDFQNQKCAKENIESSIKINKFYF